VEGQKGDGKTTLTLGAPDPIAYLKLETGDEGVVEKFVAQGKTILKKRIYYHEGNWKEAWADLRQAVKDACYSPEVQTIIFDTMTEVYELGRMAHFGGRLSQVVPREYGVIYSDMKELTRMVEGSGKNGIFIHKLEGRFDDKATLEMKGWDGIIWDMQMCVRLYRMPKGDPNGYQDRERYMGQITECRQNGKVIGEWIEGLEEEGGTFSFNHLLKLVHGAS